MVKQLYQFTQKCQRIYSKLVIVSLKKEWIVGNAYSLCAWNFYLERLLYLKFDIKMDLQILQYMMCT